MYNHEEKARNLHKQGNNCSVSLYKAFLEDIKLDTSFPAPRSIEGKCGALLTALKILKELGYEDKINNFEKQFVSKFGYSKCIDLMTHEKKCNDYIGESSKMIDSILNEN